jgi:hypothetical protein
MHARIYEAYTQNNQPYKLWLVNFCMKVGQEPGAVAQLFYCKQMQTQQYLCQLTMCWFECSPQPHMICIYARIYEVYTQNIYVS